MTRDHKNRETCLQENRLVTQLRQGSTVGWPICLGYIPIGLALGVLAQQSGFPYWAVGMMSILVFAGSAQFICVAMVTNQASAAAIILTTLVVNLRHALMSSALAVHLSGVNRWFLAFFSYGITDESFAVNMAQFRTTDWTRWHGLAVNQSTNLVWIFSTVAGCLIGQFIPQGAFGIDYALIAMFLCLLGYQLTSPIHLCTAAMATLISVLWYLNIPGESYIVGASMSAATLGYLIQRTWIRS
ncbi:MAG: branched-chain amino acid ABC transporter permease [Desulfobulbus propionicus]|nr:MAG: branched-chain amino acid ABC transporter permease [Desulfobulbus propionicus]